MASPATFPTFSFRTDYSYPCGSGNRTLLMAVSSTFAASSGAPAGLIDGAYDDGYCLVANQTVGMWWFDFSMPRYFDEIIWRQSDVMATAIYRLLGSNDDVEFTLVAENICPGITPTRKIPLDMLVSIPFRYYRLEMTSGYSPGPEINLYEIEFKIATIAQAVPIPDCDFKVNNAYSFTINENEFGDGYSQRNASGINNTRQSWSASWTNITPLEKNGILNFILRQKGFRSFKWRAPGQEEPKRWTAREPKETPVDAGYWNLSCTMRQEFDL